MRPPPPPALQDVHINRPGANGVVVRRDNIFSAAVFAADDAHDTPASRSRSRSVFARMQRKMSRLSDSLLRRNRPEKRNPTQLVAAHHVAFDRNGHTSQAPRPAARPAPSANVSDALASQVLLHRERILKMEREDREKRLAELRFDDIDDDVDEEELAVCSMRETTSKRVRQVGAREDDDTLLMIPRVASISFSAARESDPMPNVKVRQLPRVSGLMPTRASPRHPSSPITSVSPVSSTARSSASTASSGQRTLERPHKGDRGEPSAPPPGAPRNPMYRLPTALLDRDVEKEMETAIVEVASDGESDSSSDPQLQGVQERKIPGFNFDVSNGRVMSDVHQMRIPRPHAFVRRANSSLYTPNSDSDEEKNKLVHDTDAVEENEAQPSILQSEKKKSIPRSCEMFEDDYLSFQGFRSSSSERPNHHQSMSSLIRSKRISSVTDSPSDDSDEAAFARKANSRRGRGRNLLLGARFRRRHRSMSIQRIIE